MKKEKSNSYVYFAFKGDDFVPEIITKRLQIEPTKTWKAGDTGSYKSVINFSGWQLSTNKGKESIFIDNLVKEIIDILFDKIEVINELKNELNLETVLEIIVDVDTNEEESTPALGHDLKTIEFLYKTKTTTDIDIYRFNSKKAY